MWRRAVLALRIKRLRSKEKLVDINRFMHY